MNAHTAVRHLASGSVWIVLLVSLSLNVALGARLRARNAAPPAADGTPATVPPIDVRSLDGANVPVRYGADAPPTILYYFNSACGWCRRNWDAVAALERQTRGRYRFIALTGEAAVAAPSGLPRGTIHTALGVRARRLHGFSGTPHTMVISPEGRVLQSWPGAYTGATKRAVERFFKVDLPAVSRR